MSFVAPSSAQWPQDSSTAALPYDYYPVDLGGGVIGFTLDSGETNGIMTQDVDTSVEFSSNMALTSVPLKLLGDNVYFLDLEAAPSLPPVYYSALTEDGFKILTEDGFFVLTEG